MHLLAIDAEGRTDYAPLMGDPSRLWPDPGPGPVSVQCAQASRESRGTGRHPRKNAAIRVLPLGLGGGGYPGRVSA